MLTAEQKFNNQQQYLTLLTKLNIDITELTKYLDSINFFEAPATTQFHKSYAGGLCKHALDVYFELNTLCGAYFPGKYSEEDIIKVALLKDLYKAELYEAYNRNIKNEVTGQWETVVAYRNKENRPVFGDISFGSYMLAKRYVEFTDEQIEAICNYKMSNDSGDKLPDIYTILQKYPLTLMLHMADLTASNLEYYLQ